MMKYQDRSAEYDRLAKFTGDRGEKPGLKKVNRGTAKAQYKDNQS